MGPPKSARNPRPPSRSRFQEGSMNDRASAAPPVFFIDPDSIVGTGAGILGPRHHHGNPGKPFGFEKTAAVLGESEPATLTKRGSKQFLGQVWDGVLERFKFRKDAVTAAAAGDEGRRKKAPAPAPSPAPVGVAAAAAAVPRGKTSRDDERPSKEEVYANYHQLVASGFFSSHAIQSTRHQPGMRATPSPAPPTDSLAPITPAKTPSTTPQWPLTPTPTATPVCNSSKPSPSQPPNSATSSRGKKRPSISLVDDDEQGGANSHTLHLKKVRKTTSMSASRDLAVPRIRSSSRTMGLRSFSNARVPPGLPPPVVAEDEQLRQQKREPNKLTKRVFSKLPAPGHDDANLLVVPRSSSRRNVSESYHHHQARPTATPAMGDNTNGHVITAPDGSTRVLRPRRSAAEPLRVRPDANRGIPTVPDIPDKFTYGEDRENDGPWKGLRRTRAM